MRNNIIYNNVCNDNRNRSNNCDCNYNLEDNRTTCHRHDCTDDMPVGMAYVPWQQWNEIYDIEKGFKLGTIFPELNMPYLGRRCYK